MLEEETKGDLETQKISEKRELKVKTKKIDKNVMTVKFRGMKCTKQDIEDLCKRNERMKPKEPGPENCCYGGCRTCVFDVYEHHLEKYKHNKEKLTSLLLTFE